MSKIFEQGAFSRYSKRSLENATSPILEHSQFSAKTTVFISHRHDDLEDLQGVLGFLEDEYKVKVYIDSKDSSMPITTSAETAINLKDRIRKCDRFILLATNGAIESKWCNWELGFGDANKYPDKGHTIFSTKETSICEYTHTLNFMTELKNIVMGNKLQGDTMWLRLKMEKIYTVL